MSYYIYRAPEAAKVQSFPITLFDGTGSMHKEYPRAITAYKTVFNELGKKKLEYQWAKELYPLEPFKQAGSGNITNIFVSMFQTLLSEKSKYPKNITLVFISDGKEEFELEKITALIERMKNKYLIQFISVAVGDQFPNSISNTLRSLIHNHDPTCPPLFQVTRSQTKSFQQIQKEFEDIFWEIRKRLLVSGEMILVNMPVFYTITSKQPSNYIVANSIFLAQKGQTVTIGNNAIKPSTSAADIYQMIINSVQQAFICQAQVKFQNASQEFELVRQISQDLLSQIDETEQQTEEMKKEGIKIHATLNVAKQIAEGSIDLSNTKEADLTSLQDYLVSNVAKFTELASKLKSTTAKIVKGLKGTKGFTSLMQKAQEQQQQQETKETQETTPSNISEKAISIHKEESQEEINKQQLIEKVEVNEQPLETKEPISRSEMASILVDITTEQNSEIIQQFEQELGDNIEDSNEMKQPDDTKSNEKGQISKEENLGEVQIDDLYSKNTGEDNDEVEQNEQLVLEFEAGTAEDKETDQVKQEQNEKEQVIEPSNPSQNEVDFKNYEKQDDNTGNNQQKNQQTSESQNQEITGEQKNKDDKPFSSQQIQKSIIKNKVDENDVEIEDLQAGNDESLNQLEQTGGNDMEIQAEQNSQNQQDETQQEPYPEGQLLEPNNNTQILAEVVSEKNKENDQVDQQQNIEELDLVKKGEENEKHNLGQIQVSLNGRASEDIQSNEEENNKLATQENQEFLLNKESTEEKLHQKVEEGKNEKEIMDENEIKTDHMQAENDEILNQLDKAGENENNQEMQQGAENDENPSQNLEQFQEVEEQNINLNPQQEPRDLEEENVNMVADIGSDKNLNQNDEQNVEISLSAEIGQEIENSLSPKNKENPENPEIILDIQAKKEDNNYVSSQNQQFDLKNENQDEQLPKEEEDENKKLIINEIEIENLQGGNNENQPEQAGENQQGKELHQNTHEIDQEPRQNVEQFENVEEKNENMNLEPEPILPNEKVNMVAEVDSENKNESESKDSQNIQEPSEVQELEEIQNLQSPKNKGNLENPEAVKIGNLEAGKDKNLNSTEQAGEIQQHSQIHQTIQENDQEPRQNVEQFENVEEKNENLYPQLGHNEKVKAEAGIDSENENNSKNQQNFQAQGVEDIENSQSAKNEVNLENSEVVNDLQINKEEEHQQVSIVNKENQDQKLTSVDEDKNVQEIIKNNVDENEIEIEDLEAENAENLNQPDQAEYNDQEQKEKQDLDQNQEFQEAKESLKAEQELGPDQQKVELKKFVEINTEIVHENTRDNEINEEQNAEEFLQAEKMDIMQNPYPLLDENGQERAGEQEQIIYNNSQQHQEFTNNEENQVEQQVQGKNQQYRIQQGVDENEINVEDLQAGNYEENENHNQLEQDLNEQNLEINENIMTEEKEKDQFPMQQDEYLENKIGQNEEKIEQKTQNNTNQAEEIQSKGQFEEKKQSNNDQEEENNNNQKNQKMKQLAQQYPLKETEKKEEVHQITSKSNSNSNINKQEQIKDTFQESITQLFPQSQSQQFNETQRQESIGNDTALFINPKDVTNQEQLEEESTLLENQNQEQSPNPIRKRKCFWWILLALVVGLTVRQMRKK